MILFVLCARQDEPVEADSAAGDQTPGTCGLSL